MVLAWEVRHRYPPARSPDDPDRRALYHTTLVLGLHLVGQISSKQNDVGEALCERRFR